MYTVYWEGKGLKIFPFCLSTMFLVAMENVLKEIVIFDEISFFFSFFLPLNASAKKGQPAMSQCG